MRLNRSTECEPGQRAAHFLRVRHIGQRCNLLLRSSPLLLVRSPGNMNPRSLVLLLFVQTTICSLLAQEPQPRSLAQPSPKPGQQPAAAALQPAPEIQKLSNAFLGTWSVTEKIEPSQTMPNGGTGRGEEVYRLGPGEHSFTEELHLNEPTGEISGFGVAWWDENAKGYRAVWCDSQNPGGCSLMAHLAKWEGGQFVLGDEFEKDGKKFNFKEVFSQITPTSFTQTLYQGEAGKELRRLSTIYATKLAQPVASPH